MLDKGIGNLFSEPDPAVKRLELEKLEDQLQDEEDGVMEREGTTEDLMEKRIKELDDFWKGIKGGKTEI